MRVFEPVEEALGEFLASLAGVALGLTAELGVAFDAAGGGTAGLLLAPAGEGAEVSPVSGILAGKWRVRVLIEAVDVEGFRVLRAEVKWG